MSPQFDSPSVAPEALPQARMADVGSLEAFGGGAPLEKTTAAAEGLGNTAKDLAQQEYDRANQVAHLAADNAAAQKQTEIQTNISKMRGQNALQAEEYASTEWGKFSQDLLKNTQNRDQQFGVMRALGTRSQEINRFTQTHISTEMGSFADEQAKGGLENATQLAVMTPYDPALVEQQRMRANGILIDQATRKGIYKNPDGTETDAFKAMKAASVGAFDKTMIQAQLDKDTVNGVQAAQDYLKAHQDEMAPADRLSARAMVEKAETTKLSMDLWEKFNTPEYRLADGSPNIQKMNAEIMADPTLGNERKASAMAFMEGKAKEVHLAEMWQDQANEKAFYNDAVRAVKQGVPLEQAMSLARKYGKDPYTEQSFSNALTKMYAPPDRTSSDAFLALFDKNLQETLTLPEIKKAADVDGTITQAQKISLGEAVLRRMSDPEGMNPDQKQGWKQIDLIARQNFPDKTSQDEFKVLMHAVPNVDQMPSEQLIKTANDKLGKVPGTGFFGFFADPQWQADKAKLDERNAAWGGVYQNVSPGALNNVGAGILRSGRTSWGMGDLDALARAHGYKAMADVKKGDPLANALESLNEIHYPATPANVKALLEKHPSGRYTTRGR